MYVSAEYSILHTSLLHVSHTPEVFVFAVAMSIDSVRFCLDSIDAYQSVLEVVFSISRIVSGFGRFIFGCTVVFCVWFFRQRCVACCFVVVWNSFVCSFVFCYYRAFLLRRYCSCHRCCSWLLSGASVACLRPILCTVSDLARKSNCCRLF